MRKYLFGDFELDLDAVQLRLRGQPVKLERRPLDLLIMLVTRHGELVTREEIIAALWPPGVIIDFESGLNTLVRKVRGALNDSAEVPRFVETVPGRGYRFIASVTCLTQEMPGVRSGGTPLARMARGNVAALLLLLVAATTIALWSTGPREPGLMRIAVLPFDNLTGSDELDYLAWGLAEDTSTSLSRVDLADLRVIGAMSARALADSAQPVREIGRELGVDFLLLSSLRLDAPRIRVTSRLIRTTDGEQVWSASFDRELTNVLGIQRELSIAISEQVRQRLSPEVSAAIDRRQTQSPEAYAMYLKGRYEWGKLVPSANALALQYYREAVAQDPDYAVAWAGIAHLLAISRVTVGARVEHVKDEARKALETAMAIDPDLAEVQYAKGYIDYFIDADATAAEAAARRAIALDPNNAIAHMFLGILLSEQGSYVEAMDLMRRARELDPLFSLMFANSSNVAWHAGDGEAALEFAKQAIAISPENWAGYLHMGNSNLALGDFPAAARAFADAERLSGGQSAPLAALGYTLARMGQEGEARSILAELESRSGQGASPVDLASVYAGLGEFDLAFDSLYEGLAMDEVRVDWLAHDLTLLPLHADVRFAALLRCEPGSCQQSALQPEPERL